MNARLGPSRIFIEGNIATLIVTGTDQRAVVDASDASFVGRWCWKQHKHGYACRTVTGGSLVLMHREIIGDSEFDVDHINGNKLDNRRENLRAATRVENSFNRGKQANNTSGFKGVSFDRQRGLWRASIKVGPVQHTIGRFNTAQEAADAYDVEARLTAGKFAKVNSVCPDVARAIVEANTGGGHG